MGRDAWRLFNTLLFVMHLTVSLSASVVSYLNQCTWTKSGVSCRVPNCYHLDILDLQAYIVDDDRLPIITCPALCLPPGLSVPRPGRVATQYTFTAKFSPDPTAEYMYDVIDSGTSRHILNTDAFYLAREESHVSFTCIGGHREYTKKHGIWAGLCTDDTGKDYHFCSYGTYVPTAGAFLLSVGQLVHHGNLIVHEGQPKTGKHGMYLRNRAVQEVADGLQPTHHRCRSTPASAQPVGAKPPPPSEASRGGEGAESAST
eukprot:2100217-Rhodomonas_salina.1